MKKYFFAFAFLFVRLVSIGQTDTLVLNQVYEGKNIYLQGCIINISVNGQNTDDYDFSSPYEIDLKNYKLKQGDSIHVQIIHEKECSVEILDPQLFRPVIAKYIEISVDTSGTLKILNWEAKNEPENSIFIVEQFRWNKWQKIGEVEARRDGKHEYQFIVCPTSGKNKFRVKLVDHNNPPKISDAAILNSNKTPVKLKSSTIHNTIEFSSETLYELNDKNGGLVKRGYGKTIDCKDFPKGNYSLNYDNTTAQIEIL
jgi:hypothetical protein